MLTNRDLVVCDKCGHVYDMTGAVADSKQLAAISPCPNMIDNQECGGRIVWINPIKTK